MFGQLLGEFPLRLNRTKDGLLALGQQPHLGQPSLNLPNLFLVQPARLVFTITGDEGNGIALVEQLYRGLDLTQGDIQTASDLSQINRYRICHIHSILPRKAILYRAIGFPGSHAPGGLAGTNRIFLENHQTRKTPVADTTRHRQGGPIKEGSAHEYQPFACLLRPSEESANVTVADSQRETVTVPLMEIMPLLADAVQSQRTWLRDFADDEVTISMDLYEVILAYQHYRRPSA